MQQPPLISPDVRGSLATHHGKSNMQMRPHQDAIYR